MKYFLTYASCLALSMYFVDIESDNVLFSVVAPLGIGIFILLIMIWFLLKGASSQSQANSGDAAPFSNDIGSGGDG